MADQCERERTKRLGTLIQAAPGWADSHLHEFEIAGERYGIPDPEFGFREPVIYEAWTVPRHCIPP